MRGFPEEQTKPNVRADSAAWPRGRKLAPPPPPVLRPAAVAVSIVAGIAIIFAAFDLVHSGHVKAVSLKFASDRFADKLERESLQQRTVFARMVAHEIRTPASSICGALDLFKTTELAPAQRQFLDIVARGAEAILTLVEDMMSAANEDGGDGEIGAEAQFRLTPVRVDPVSAFLSVSLPLHKNRPRGAPASARSDQVMVLHSRSTPAGSPPPARALPQRTSSRRRGTPRASRSATRATCARSASPWTSPPPSRARRSWTPGARGRSSATSRGTRSRREKNDGPQRRDSLASWCKAPRDGNRRAHSRVTQPLCLRPPHLRAVHARRRDGDAPGGVSGGAAAAAGDCHRHWCAEPPLSMACRKGAW